MQSKKEREKVGRQSLQRIIQTCRSVEERSLDPFLINIDENIGTVKQHFPEWSIPEDLCLDAETVHSLASVIRLQGEWVKHRSTSLYTDPFLLEEKIVRLQKEEIARTFLKAWHPIIGLEQISIHSLKEAIRYWDILIPMDERWKQGLPDEVKMGFATRGELMQEKILLEKAFSEELESFWQELKKSVQNNNESTRIRYWDFVGASTYGETVQRAFMTSFLVTYGYATLEVYPLEEEIFIKPHEKQEDKISKGQLVSIPIALSVENWVSWKRGKRD